VVWLICCIFLFELFCPKLRVVLSLDYFPYLCSFIYILKKTFFCTCYFEHILRTNFLCTNICCHNLFCTQS
jgi:hypothetical protein